MVVSLWNLTGILAVWEVENRYSVGIGIAYCIRQDMRLNNSHNVYLFNEIDKDTIGKERNAIVGTVYRPPGTDIKAILHWCIHFGRVFSHTFLYGVFMSLV